MVVYSNRFMHWFQLVIFIALLMGALQKALHKKIFITIFAAVYNPWADAGIFNLRAEVVNLKKRFRSILVRRMS